jgi:hypothetical protein
MSMTEQCKDAGPVANAARFSAEQIAFARSAFIRDGWGEDSTAIQVFDWLATCDAAPQAECAPRAELSDEQIREVIARFYGACATDQEMRLARTLLAASKEPK